MPKEKNGRRKTKVRSVWTEFDVGVGFEQNDGECWWMSFPTPPEWGDSK